MPPAYFSILFFHIVPRKRELRCKSTQVLIQRATKRYAFCYF